MNSNFISVILPSYNDAPIIIPFYEAITAVLKKQNKYSWELIYVDDGSSDNSVEVLKSLAQKDERVSVVEFARNFGQQKAFMAGLKRVKGDIIITLDGDFQYNPQCILDLADKISEGFDIASGIRHNRQDSFLSKYISKVGQRFVSKALNQKISDFGSVKGFSRFLVDQIVKYETYCTVVQAMAYSLTNKVIEIPVEHLERPYGESKWSTLKRIHLYFDIFLGFSDFRLTGLIKLGLVMIMMGFLTLGILLYLYIIHNFFYFHTFTAVTSLSVIIVGIFFILTSFALSFLLRIYRLLLWKNDTHLIRKIYSRD